jgi:hypothetical protein
VLTKDEGGRYTPFMANYRPQLFIRTADVTVALSFPTGTPDAAEKMVMPGDHVELVCELVHDVPADVGTRFTLREGGKTGQSSGISFCLNILSSICHSWYWHNHQNSVLGVGNAKETAGIYPAPFIHTLPV